MGRCVWHIVKNKDVNYIYYVYYDLNSIHGIDDLTNANAHNAHTLYATHMLKDTLTERPKPKNDWTTLQQNLNWFYLGSDIIIIILIVLIFLFARAIQNFHKNSAFLIK